MALVFTLLIFALMVFAIIKKIDLKIILLGLIALLLAYLTITSGSVLGDAGTGSVIVDCFTYLANYLSTNIGGVAFTIILVFAYVELMGEVQATAKLASYLKRPLQKINNRYVVACFVIVIGAVLKIFIATGPALVALLIGTFMPILLACGCSYGASCAAMLVYMMGSYGPVEPTATTAAAMMGFETNATEWFINTQLPMVGIILALTLVVYVISTYFFDKTDHCEIGVAQKGTDEPEAPAIYAMLPMLPVIIMVIFSPLVVSTISMSINTAVVISTVIAAVVIRFFNRKPVTFSEIVNKFFTSFCNNLKNLGMTIILAMCFAALLNSVGGLKNVADILANTNISPVVLVEIICLIGAAISFVTGSFFGALSIIAPLAGSLSSQINLPIEVLCSLVLISVSVGTNCTPINPGVLTITGKCNITPANLIKRIAPVCWTAMILGIPVVFAVFGR